MKKKITFVFSLLFYLGFALAQYAPPVGEAGTTAIPADSSIIIGWANGVEVARGAMDIRYPELGLTSLGTDNDALGSADNITISLGDGGRATLTFAYPLYDGEGWDLVVFENSFDGNFLELAFVEVSSDGEHFFRFPSHSLTDTINPIGSFGLLDARKINNLAGKYIFGYGTPFDLSELKDEEGLDVMHITQVRVVDVVGTLDDHWCSYDAQGRKINDPFPTDFVSGGFDLDAVGVLYWNIDNGSEEERVFAANIFPNPVKRGYPLTISSSGNRIKSVHLYSLDGKRNEVNYQMINSTQWQITGLQPGVWIIELADGVHRYLQKVVVY